MRTAAVVLSVCWTFQAPEGQTAGQDSQALERMVAHERAFAAATAEIGVRDGFLAFFAEDAVSISGGPGGAVLGIARDALRKMPRAQLPLASKLTWEPVAGQVSADGTLGWLTGPYTAVDQKTSRPARRGAYFSVWKRGTDGAWRVWLDEGITLPQPWTGAGPFRPTPEPRGESGAPPGEDLQAAERSVAGAGDSWSSRLAEAVRVHRDGRMPMLGREQAAGWSRNAWTSLRYTVLRTESAGSGDLGIAMGGYEGLAGGRNETGTWVRVWQRDSGRRWFIVFETSKGQPGK